MLKIECWGSEQIQTTITFCSDVGLSLVIYRDARNWIWKLLANSNDNNFYSDVWLSLVICRDPRNWMLKLWANSNDNNFLLGCLIESRNISRRSKLNVDPLSQFKRQKIFTRMSDWVPIYIETLEIECWSSEPIQTTITFYSDVWLSPVI